MSEQINDGGAAFPQTQQFEELTPAGGGMSLRDYFAAKAMQAMVQAEYGNRCVIEVWAKDAYQAADAMLKARNESSK